MYFVWITLQWPFKVSPSYNLLFIDLKKSKTCYFDSLITSESLNFQIFKFSKNIFLSNKHIWPSSKKTPLVKRTSQKTLCNFKTFNFNKKYQIYSQNKQVSQVERLKKSWFQWEKVVICRWTLTPSATWCYHLWIWQGPKLQQYVITFDSKCWWYYFWWKLQIP